MKWSKFHWIFIGGLFFHWNTYAQNTGKNLSSKSFSNLSEGDKILIDSITPLINSAPNDSIKISYVSFLGENTWGIDVWTKYNQLVYDISERNLKINPKSNYYLKYKGGAINNFGYYYNELGNSSLALKNYLKALDIAISNKDSMAEVTCYNNIGVVYKRLGAPVKALSYYQKALKISIKNKNERSESIVYSHLAEIYDLQNDTLNAFKHFNKALSIKKKLKDEQGIAQVQQGLANLYFKSKDFQNASILAMQSYKTNKLIGHQRSTAENLLLMGKIFLEKNQFDSSFVYLNKGLEIKKSINDKAGEAKALFHIGELNFKNKNYKSASEFLEKAYILFSEEKFLKEISESSLALSQLYQSTSKFEKALKYHKIYTQNESLIKNQEVEKQLIRYNLQSEFNQKELELKHTEEKKAVLTKEKNNRKNIILSISIICLVIVIILFIYLYNRFKIISAQKDTILKQQTLLEFKNTDLHHKNKLVKDSIVYAKHITNTITPSKKLLENIFSNYFILFKPKDIVSGDFHWAYNINENTSILVIADCTGHGVPGAMLSIICASLLDKVVTRGIIQPNLVLTEFYLELEAKLKNGDDELKDGVEMSVCLYNKKENELQLAASYHKMYYVENKMITEYAGDKIQKDFENTPFTLHQLKPNKGSMLYLFSDGYPDQKGGVKNKKLFYQPFREILSEISNEKVESQKELLNSKLLHWRGTNEQYDDILVFGIQF